MRRNAKLAAIAVLVLAVMGACASSERDSLGAPSSGAANEGGSGGKRIAYDAAARGSDGFGPAALDSSLPAAGPQVIKRGDVALRVPEGDLQEAVRRIVAIAEGRGGFVLSTSIEDEGAKSGTIVIRVPAESFEDALSAAEDVGDVTREEVSGEDVSEEFVDLDARLRNFEAQESVLLDLMAKSQNVADTLRVQRELQGVQLEIERLRGRLRFLRDQTDLSTITVSLREQETTVAATGLLGRAWKRAVDTFNAIVSGVVVALSVAIPVGLVLILLLVIVRLVRPHIPAWGPRDARG
jgi:hypothetical protein